MTHFRSTLLAVLVHTVLLLSVVATDTLPDFAISRCPSPIPPPSSDAWLSMSSTFPRKFQLASGMGYPEEPTAVYACFSDEAIHLKFVTKDSKIESNFTRCNEPLFKMDAVETFLGNVNFGSSYDLHHYLELEVNPNGALFVAKITNPELKCLNLTGDQQTCATSGISWNAGQQPPSWWAYVGVPWKLLGAPGGAKQMQHQPYQWRGNFFRIDLLSTGRQFSCWSPTFSDPACFHQPNCFGNLKLDFSG